MGQKKPTATAPMKTMQPHDDLERFFGDVQGHEAEWIYQIKWDGARCLYDTTYTEFYSRAGTLYPNFNLFGPDCNRLAAWLDSRCCHGCSTLDGEMAGGNFTKIMNVLFKKSDVDVSNITYHVFDIPMPELTFVERDELLTAAFKELSLPHLHKVETNPCPTFGSIAEIESFIRRLNDLGMEGCVFKRKDSLYRFGKKTPGYWAKGILDKSLDLPVADVMEGQGKLAGCIGKFICVLPDEFGDELVEVGPGRATHAELKLWWENRDECPAQIKTLFKAPTKGNKSLRHPRFGNAREDK